LSVAILIRMPPPKPAIIASRFASRVVIEPPPALVCVRILLLAPLRFQVQFARVPVCPVMVLIRPANASVRSVNASVGPVSVSVRPVTDHSRRWASESHRWQLPSAMCS